MPINPQLAQGIFGSIVRNINEGKVYKENNFYDGIIDKYKVLFLKATEYDRDVLRVILPDQNGLFPDDNGCEPIYKWQKSANVE